MNDPSYKNNAIAVSRRFKETYGTDYRLHINLVNNTIKIVGRINPHKNNSSYLPFTYRNLRVIYVARN